MIMTDAERFNYKCPYNDKPCLDFQCIGCPVEEEERQYMEELNRQDEEDIIDQAIKECDTDDKDNSCGT